MQRSTTCSTTSTCDTGCSDNAVVTGTTVIQCPVPSVLQPFCRENGSIVWRQAVAQHGCCDEKWFIIVNGVLSCSSEPTDLVGQCDVAYLGPTCVVDGAGNRYQRWTVVLPSGTNLGVLFVDESTGQFATDVDPAAVTVCTASTVECEDGSGTATLVKQCGLPEQLLRSQRVFDCTNARELVQEVWYDPNTGVREVRYFECLSDMEVIDVNVNDLIKCDRCEADGTACPSVI